MFDHSSETWLETPLLSSSDKNTSDGDEIEKKKKKPKQIYFTELNAVV